MTKRLPYLTALLFLLAVPLRGSPQIGAQVQTWNYDPRTNMVTLEIVNTSHKDITAFNITIKETYADGRVVCADILRGRFYAVCRMCSDSG